MLAGVEARGFEVECYTICLSKLGYKIKHAGMRVDEVRLSIQGVARAGRSRALFRPAGGSLV